MSASRSNDSASSDPGGPTLDAGAARRSQLLGVKLTALVREHLDLAPDSLTAEAFAPGAALLLAPGPHEADSAAWVLLDDGSGPRLGAALAWARRRGAASLDIIAAPDDAGVIARRAAEFAFPIRTWIAEDRTLCPALPAPYVEIAAVPGDHQAFRDLIIEGGAVPLEEGGALVGEVRGLEVCRVVDDAATGTTRLEVGVGAHDREAFTMMHGDTPTVDSLRRVVAAVDRHRAPGADPHPLNRLGAERLDRWNATEHPDRVGALALEPAEPPEVRPNLKDAVPAVARGRGDDGRPIVAVFSAGVDLELVPFAADARARLASADADGTRLMIATPERDRIAITTELAALLREPAEFVSSRPT